MSKEIKLIPELRFPEFEDQGEWSLVPLIQTADKNIKWSFTGGPFGANLKASDYTESGFRIIQLQNIGDGEFHDEYKIYTSQEKADELLSCNIFAGDIILSKMGDPVGRACLIPSHLERCVMASDGIRLAVDENQFSKYFIYSLINSKLIREAIEGKSTGSTRKRIGLGELKEVKLTVPKEIKEQQKIASCLSSLDELLAAHNDKLDALKDHKKGLLQNLFPNSLNYDSRDEMISMIDDKTNQSNHKNQKNHSSDNVPKLRFPEFEGDGEWVETTLEQVADYENGKAHEKDIDENGDYIVVNSKFISTEGETVKYSDTAFCPANLGDILMVLSDVPNGKAIAKCFYVDEENRYSVNQRICRITATDCDSRFLFYIMDKNAYFLSFDDGVKQTNLRKSDVMEFPFRIPTNPVEQTKIATCISAVDELITAQQEKIEQLQQHKKGLMQGLFPKAITN